MMQGINCKKCEELLSLRWDSESLNAGDEASLNAHLSQCVSCTRLASEMGALLGESQQMASLKYPREIQISPLILRPSRPNLVMPWVFAAGFGMIMLVMGFGLSSRMIASQEGEMHTQHVSQASAVAVSGPVGD
ncbi:zf-HC2 domain-containing protein, partial [Myxococcota bacterium]|nr:zf-HC2 domain-containing protein [Myxococcota bacterium]